MKERVYSLDFLRLAATICIVFHHYQQLTGAFYEGGLNFYGGKFSFGYCVEFFFVLSGFLQYGEAAKIKNKSVSFIQYYIKKLIRLMPMLIMSTLVMTGLIEIYHKLTGIYWMDTRPDIWTLWINLLGLSAGWGFNVPTINSPLWYISSLLLCYVVLYVEVRLSEAIRINEVFCFVFMVIVSLGLCEYGADFVFINAYSCRAFYSFFTGILLGYAADRVIIGKKLLLTFLFGIIFITWMIIYHYSFISNGVSYIMACIYFPMLILLFSFGIPARLFKNKKWMTVGKITFDIYVWHIPVLITVEILKTLCGYGTVGGFGEMLLYTAICIVFGTGIYFWADTKIEKWLMENYYDKKFQTGTIRNN